MTATTPRPLAVAFVVSNPGFAGGLEIASALSAKALRDAGCEVSLIHASQLPSSMDEPGGAYHATQAIPALFDRAAAAFRTGVSELRHFLAANRINLVHIHQPGQFRIAPALQDQWPVVVTVHGPLCPNGARLRWRTEQACYRKAGAVTCLRGALRDGCAHTANGQAWPTAGFIRAIQRDRSEHRALAAAVSIAPSHWMHDQLVRDGLDPANIRVLGNCTDPAPSAQLRAESIPPEFLVVSRLERIKGIEYVLRASALITAPHTVVIAGEGPALSALRGLADTLGIASRCRFVGLQTAAQLAELRNRARAAILPSIFQENLSQSGREALAEGVPVIASNVGGIPDWCRHEGTGLLVEPHRAASLAAAMQRLIRDPSLAHRLGQAGRRLSAEWTRERHGNELLAIYRSAQRRATDGGSPA